VVHGTGAETPTQVVLFASAAAVGSTGGAGVVLGAFVIGLIVSDLAVALIWLSGRLGVGHLPGGQLALGLITGIGSLGVGVTFILEKSFLLPSLVGG
jgi:high-affinity nickel-transport protein